MRERQGNLTPGPQSGRFGKRGISPCTSIHGNASSRKISRPAFATVGSSNVPTFRIIIPGRVPGSSAIDEPHSGQKCLRIGLPLPPRLVNVLSVPSIVTASLFARTSAAKGASGEFLAIPAMAHCRARRVGLGGIAHRAAQAAAFDLHLDPLTLSYPFGQRPN